jgi:hypothetical protein
MVGGNREQKEKPPRGHNRYLRDVAGYNQRQRADELGQGERTIRRWDQEDQKRGPLPPLIRTVTMRLGPIPDVETSYPHHLGVRPTRVMITETTEGTEAQAFFVRADQEHITLKAQTNCSGVVALTTAESQPGSASIIAELL